MATLQSTNDKEIDINQESKVEAQSIVDSNKPKSQDKSENNKQKSQDKSFDKKAPEKKPNELKSKKEPEKIEKPKHPKKKEAIARGQDVRASKKQCTYICTFIKGKSIDNAISDIESVINMKRPIPFKGEIPHKKGKGMMSGRYPVKASQIFIKLLKGLRGSVIQNGLDLDKTRLKICSATNASRPLRRGNVEAKRSDIILIAREFEEKGGKN
jgi:large subunit ribosomal protein L22